MRIAIASDHRGFKLKESIKVLLKFWGHKFEDFGTFNEEPCDYPDFAKAVVDALKNGYDFGILICGTGIGMSMAANRFGNRAAVCRTVEDAKLAREHNNANVLCLGEHTRFSEDVVKAFLETPFSGEERHERRIKKFDG
jgi:ribose 5-phosphate isomerase B